MKNPMNPAIFLPLLMTLAAASVLADTREQCKQQVEQVLARLQSEVVGELDAAQRASASQIVLEVCQVREQEVVVEVEQAVQQARDEEQEKVNSWFTESADKPGNKRLQRKSH